MSYKYKVPRFSIMGDVITGVFGDSQVESIIVHLYEDGKGGQSDALTLDVYAADINDRRLRDVDVDLGNLRKVPLKNEFVERKMYITREMVEEVSTKQQHGQQVALIIEFMRLTPKSFNYKGSEHPGDYDKDFVAYHVFFKRKKK